MTRTDLVVLIPVGPGQLEPCLDTLESVDHYILEPHVVVLVDDCTSDGTYEGLMECRRAHWRPIRAERPNGIRRLAFTVTDGIRYCADQFSAKCLLKLDTDSLLIRPGLLTDACEFMNRNPSVGIFGRHLINADGAVKDYAVHTRRLLDALSWRRRLTLRRPSYAALAQKAVRYGWGLGQNVFGGGYFVRWDVLGDVAAAGALTPRRWGWAPMSEDAYLTMCVAACGYAAGHFAAPNGPLCLGWKGLPFKPQAIRERGYKLIHSADSGPNTEPDPMTGVTPRAFFRSIRQSELAERSCWAHSRANVAPASKLDMRRRREHAPILLSLTRLGRKRVKGRFPRLVNDASSQRG